MSNPNLWYLFMALFCVAGALNLARGLRRHDNRRALSLGLGIAGFLWASSAGLFRFVNPTAGYAAAAVAAIVMVGASMTSLKQ